MTLEDDILTVLIQTSRQNLEPGELAKKIADKLKARMEAERKLGTQQWCETCGVHVGHLFPHD